jgi:hypothetical protein
MYGTYGGATGSIGGRVVPHETPSTAKFGTKVQMVGDRVVGPSLELLEGTPFGMNPHEVRHGADEIAVLVDANLEVVRPRGHGTPGTGTASPFLRLRLLVG